MVGSGDWVEQVGYDRVIRWLGIINIHNNTTSNYNVKKNQPKNQIWTAKKIPRLEQIPKSEQISKKKSKSLPIQSHIFPNQNLSKCEKIFTKSKPQIYKSKPIKTQKNLNKDHNHKFPNQHKKSQAQICQVFYAIIPLSHVSNSRSWRGGDDWKWKRFDKVREAAAQEIGD